MRPWITEMYFSQRRDTGKGIPEEPAAVAGRGIETPSGTVARHPSERVENKVKKGRGS